ncbi:MAG: MATE family efflux transporter [Caldithrix sp.]|nr:MATE family efflux transporter [Caldithrix sp.]
MLSKEPTASLDEQSKKPFGTLKAVLKTSFPAAVDLSSQTITWLIEAIFIGQLSALALAGVGIAQQVLVLTFTILLTFVVGSSIIIVRYLGAKDQWHANHVFGQALFIGIIFSLIIGLIWYFIIPFIFEFIKEEGDKARMYGVVYIKTVAFFSPFIITNFVALGILRGVGNTMLTMTISLVVNGLNILLSPILIFGLFSLPRLETFGAGLAVGIAHTTGFLITLTVLRTRRCSLFLAISEITSPKFKTVKRLFKMGVPTTIEQFVWASGQIVLSLFAARINVTVLAAHQVMVRIQSVLSMVNWGFAVAGMSLVGRNIGGKDFKEAKKSGQLISLVAVLNAGVIAMILYIFAEQSFSIFTDEPMVIKAGVAVFLAFAILQLPKAANTAYAGNLRGTADLNWLMWLAIGAVVINELAGAYVLSFGFGLGLLGLWVIQIFDEGGRLVLNYWRFNRGKWKKIP